MKIDFNTLHSLASFNPIVQENGFSCSPVIELIKLYRSVSGIGLKDSKDAIFACANKMEGYTIVSFDFDKLLNLFRPYMDETILEKEINDKLLMDETILEKEINDKLLKGIECAINNFAILGFSDKWDAAASVIERFREKHV